MFNLADGLEHVKEMLNESENKQTKNKLTKKKGKRIHSF